MMNVDDMSETSISQRAGKERIMEILVFLLAEMRSNKQLIEIDLRPLSQRGFSQTEISTAFSWLFDRIGTHGFEESPVELTPSFIGELVMRRNAEREYPLHEAPFRVYHEAERSVLSVEAQGYLLQIQELGLIDSADLELIIDRVMMAGVPSVSLADIKELIGIMVFDFDDLTFTGSRIMLSTSDRVQ
jgi:Smg protein